VQPESKVIIETATVIGVEDDLITVSASVKTGCSQCQVSDDCGTSAVAKAFTPRQQTLTMRSPLPVKPGDLVVIGIPEQKVLLASWLVYIVPLVTLIGGVIGLNQLTNWHELAVFGAAILLSAGSVKLVARYLARARNARFEPVIVSRVNDKAQAV
tara:strand:- start:2664 stop:3131 length:468 start_codon:yes stop_codon:yes gene_type:complete